MSPLSTRIQAKKKCQRRPIARSWEDGSVAQAGKPRSSSSPSSPRDAPSTPVVLKECPKIVVRPAVAFPSSSRRAESEKKGLSKLVVCAQVSNGLALKICIPLINSTTKQIALTQWQTRTSAECLATSRPSGAACAGRAEDSDVNPGLQSARSGPGRPYVAIWPDVSRRDRDFC